MAEHQDSRQLLIDCAMRLFAERGFDATSTRQIVEAAGLNISLISYYFHSKEGLLEACLRQVLTRVALEAQPETPATTAGEFADRVQQLVKQFLAAHVRDPHMHRVVQREIERDSAPFRLVLRDSYLATATNLVNFLRRGQEHGWVSAALDPMTAALALHGAMLQQIRLDRVRREFFGKGLEDDAVFARVVADVTQFIRQGLAPVADDGR